ncbi:unnamed protein product, partial [Nesidiocoris tenuis]
LTEERVAAFLNDNPEFLERYVMEELEIEQLERWIIRRTQRDKKRAVVSWRMLLVHFFKNMLKNAWYRFRGIFTVLRPRRQKANAARLDAVVTAEAVCRQRSVRIGQLHIVGGVGGRLSTLSARQRRRQSSLSIPRLRVEGSGDIAHLLLEPLVQPDGQLVAVLEMWRLSSGPGPFHEEDEEIATSYIVWGGIALHYAKLYMSMSKQRKLSDFLLAVVK